MLRKAMIIEMDKINFKPFENTDGTVVGYLHMIIDEMPVRREKYPAVVVCPGGGYGGISQREADPVALRFFAAGYNVFILTYSVAPKASDFIPLRELSETVCRIRENAEEYRVDAEHIAVCGFSAGGHLAASLGTLWDDPRLLEKFDSRGGKNRPDAMILGYPVITADEFAHVGSIENVSGCKEGTEGYRWFSLDKHVSEKTCPAFLWHTVTDDGVPVENSIAFISALQRNKISYEAHLFPEGPHGMSVCTEEVRSKCDYTARWMDMCIEWLGKEFGYTL